MESANSRYASLVQPQLANPSSLLAPRDSVSGNLSCQLSSHSLTHRGWIVKFKTRFCEKTRWR
jgi:hypothetical protein